MTYWGGSLSLFPSLSPVGFNTGGTPLVLEISILFEHLSSTLDLCGKQVKHKNTGRLINTWLVPNARNRRKSERVKFFRDNGLLWLIFSLLPDGLEIRAKSQSAASEWVRFWLSTTNSEQWQRPVSFTLPWIKNPWRSLAEDSWLCDCFQRLFCLAKLIWPRPEWRFAS